MADELDLDAIQAAEAEDAGEGLSFKFGGETFTLPGVLPMEFLLDTVRFGLKHGLDLVLGDQAAAFWSHKPGRKVIETLDERIAKHYGFGKWGNSSASPEPSSNGTGRSRPISAAITG